MKENTLNGTSVAFADTRTHRDPHRHRPSLEHIFLIHTSNMCIENPSDKVVEKDTFIEMEDQRLKEAAEAEPADPFAMAVRPRPNQKTILNIPPHEPPVQSILGIVLV